MSVSTRNIKFVGAATSVLMILGGSAVAGGMGGGSSTGGTSGCGPHCGTGPSIPGAVFPGSPGVVIPGAGVGQPNISFGGGMGQPSSGSGCCGSMPPTLGVVVPGVNIAGPDIVVGGPSVSVNTGTLNVTGGSTLNTSSFTGSRKRTGSFLGGGGGGYYDPTPAPTSQLNVPGETETYTEQVQEQVPVTEQYCRDEITQTSSIRPVQAVCLDDKGTPHPASRTDNSRNVSRTYKGEVFRCMSGTQMQVTLGYMNGDQANFDRADTFSCRKGEALVHSPGGELKCATQMPQRNCNERSLLRRNGPGIKLVETRGSQKACIPQTRTTYQTVTRNVTKSRELPGMSMPLNGGVGNGY